MHDFSRVLEVYSICSVYGGLQGPVGLGAFMGVLRVPRQTRAHGEELLPRLLLDLVADCFRSLAEGLGSIGVAVDSPFSGVLQAILGSLRTAATFGE